MTTLYAQKVYSHHQRKKRLNENKEEQTKSKIIEISLIITKSYVLNCGASRAAVV